MRDSILRALSSSDHLSLKNPRAYEQYGSAVMDEFVADGCIRDAHPCRIDINDPFTERIGTLTHPPRSRADTACGMNRAV
jgi:hypothetical protein